MRLSNSRIPVVIAALALLASTVIVPAFAQQEFTPDSVLNEEEEIQRELSASEAEIQKLVNEDFIEAAPLSQSEGEIEQTSLAAAPKSQRLRALAQAKTQIGYKDTPAGSNCNNFSRYFDRGCQPWCADFVSWAFDWQGNKDKKVRWNNPSTVASILAWAKKNNHLVTSPQPGDIFLIKTRSASHTGFVRTVNAETGKFTTVEGNTSTDNVSSGQRTISRYQFVRFP